MRSARQVDEARLFLWHGYDRVAEPLGQGTKLLDRIWRDCAFDNGVTDSHEGREGANLHSEVEFCTAPGKADMHILKYLDPPHRPQVSALSA